MFLKPVQAAELLGLTEATVRRYARQGIIPARRFGKHWRFLESELRDAGEKNFYRLGLAIVRPIHNSRSALTGSRVAQIAKHLRTRLK